MIYDTAVPTAQLFDEVETEPLIPNPSYEVALRGPLPRQVSPSQRSMIHDTAVPTAQLFDEVETEPLTSDSSYEVALRGPLPKLGRVTRLNPTSAAVDRGGEDDSSMGLSWSITFSVLCGLCCLLVYLFAATRTSDPIVYEEGMVMTK